MSREIYRDHISPFLDKRDSERWHKRAVDALHIAESTSFGLKLIEYASYQHERFQDPRLEVELGGVVFENPLLVGAGWDKAGRAVKGLHALGFAGVEVGSGLKHYITGAIAEKMLYNSEHDNRTNNPPTHLS